MSQDFANKRKSNSKGNKKKPARAATRNNNETVSHWGWFFSGLFSGVFICVVGWLAANHLGPSSPLSDNTAGLGQEQDGDGTNLDFYEYLPQAEVEVDVVPVEVADSSGIEKNPVTYFLQAGSFIDPNDAEELRARLILMNLDTKVQPTPLSGRTWYRVQAGPFVGRRSVEAAENILRQNNIDPLRLRE